MLASLTHRVGMHVNNQRNNGDQNWKMPLRSTGQVDGCDDGGGANSGHRVAGAEAGGIGVTAPVRWMPKLVDMEAAPSTV